MKIFAGTIVLTIAVFLLKSVESAPSGSTSGGKSYNINEGTNFLYDGKEKVPVEMFGQGSIKNRSLPKTQKTAGKQPGTFQFLQKGEFASAYYAPALVSMGKPPLIPKKKT